MVNFVAENKSNFVIIPEDKNQAAVYAAKELKKYVFLSTGAILWIKGDTSLNQYRFYIGKKYFEKCSDVDIDLNGDGFILKISKNEIYLTAKTDRGLIFGVYRFLEKYLGIRFFNYDCEKIPETDNLILQETTHIEKPTFAMRSYLITATWQGHSAFNLSDVSFFCCLLC